MMPHERALELLTLATQDERAASVLETAGMSDALVGFHYQQAVEGSVGRAGCRLSQC